MRKWTTTRTTTLLFLAAASVYPSQGFGAAPARLETSTRPPVAHAQAKDDTGGVKVLDEPTVIPIDATAPLGQTAQGDKTTTELPGTVSGLDESGRIKAVDVVDADIVNVLRLLSTNSGKNIVASKDVRGRITAHLSDVTVKEALDALLRANGFEYREKGNFIYVYTQVEFDKIVKSERQLTTEVFRVFYSPVDTVATMIKPALSENAEVSFTKAPQQGIASNSSETGGSSHAAEDILVVRDYADNMEKIRSIIKEIDRRPQQILIEATILRAALSEDNAFGIDFTLFGGVDFNQINASSSSAADALSGNIANNPNAGGIIDSGYAGAGTGFTSGTKGVPAGGLRLAFLKNNVGVFLSALEEVTDTVVLANPKVLALNKQKGEVIVGKKTGYLTTTLTESTAVQTVEFLETGTRLIFRPFIGDDGFIRMEIHPEDSDGGLVNNLPVKTTTEVTSNILVRDGHTVVIGGLFRESNDVGRGQVPGLGNAPIIGPLFRRQHDRTTREEIIILLTPHIVKDEKAYSDSSEQVLKDGEALRMGVRNGMMSFGRQRLAECSYDKAVAEMNKPNPDSEKALHYLDCATNLQPTFLEALKMKEKLTGREITGTDGSTIRSFVRRQILAERGGIEKINTVPPVDSGPVLYPATYAPATRPATQQVISALPATAPTTRPQASIDTEAGEDICGAAATTAPAVAGKVLVSPARQVVNTAGLEDASRLPANKPAAATQARTSWTSFWKRDVFTWLWGGDVKRGDPAGDTDLPTITELPTDELPGTEDQSK